MKKQKKRYWVEEEDAILKQCLSEEIGPEEIVLRLKDGGFERNYGMIKSRAHHLGIPISSSNIVAKKRWSEKEDKLIKRFFKKGLNGNEITNELNELGFKRNRPAVKKRIQTLGLKTMLGWSKEECELLHSLLNKGWTVGGIRKELSKNGFKRTKTAICGRIYYLGNKLNDYNVKTKHSLWTKEEDELLKELWPQRMLTTKQMVKTFREFGFDRSYDRIKERSQFLKLKNDFDIRVSKHIYTKDEDFFNEPNELNCSLSGIIGSDGTVTKGKGQTENSYILKLALARKDECLLKKIKKETKYNGKITRYEKIQTIKIKGQKPRKPKLLKCSILSFRNVRIWKDNLEKHWNITPRKTYTLQPPNLSFNDINLCLAYYCGLVSGDGSVGFHRYNTKGEKCGFGITLLGTKTLLEWCKKMLSHYLGKNLVNKIRKCEGECYSFRICGKNAIKVYEKIRTLNCIFLDRKWNNPKILSILKKEKARLGLS